MRQQRKRCAVLIAIPFVSEALTNACRSQNWKICSKCRTEGNWSNYKKQRSSCVNLLCNSKGECFQKLTMKDLSNKKNWKVMTPYFSNKGWNSNKLMLKENWLITEGKVLATVMSTFFVNIAQGPDKKKRTIMTHHWIPFYYHSTNGVVEKFKYQRLDEVEKVGVGGAVCR